MELIVGSRQAVFDMERLMRQAPQVELKVKHYFSKGVYARELHIPAGVILTGEIHKFENLNILSQGKIEVLTEKGLVAESSSKTKEQISFRVGQHVFEGVVTKIKKMK